MAKRIHISKEYLENLLKDNRVSLRDLEAISGYSRSTLSRNIKRYNLEHLLLSEEELKKLQYSKIRDSLNKNVFSNEDTKQKVIEKRKKTVDKKYGSWEKMYQENAEKSKITNTQKYGVDNPMKNPRIQKRAKKRTLQKYGVENAGWTKESQRKIIATNMKRYGKEFHKNKHSYTKDFSFDKMANDKTLLKEFLKSLPEKATLNQLAELFKLDYTTVQKKIKKMGLYEHISLLSGTSYFEEDIVSFLKELGSFEIIRRDRTILNGLELDIYIPEKKLAIEVNGGFWHSSRFKEKRYHQKKTIACEELGIRLIHIIDSQWKNQKNIFKSIIKNALGLFDEKIYARKCEVKEITSEDIGLFLTDNHLQGFAPAKVYLGLYHNSTLVQVMTFNKSFKSKGYDYELTRNSILLNTTVIGGTEKLFKYFLSNYEPESIVSYVDTNIFSGTSYYKMGFELSHVTEPNLMWIRGGESFYRSPKKHQEYTQLKHDGKMSSYFGSGLKVFTWKSDI